MDAANPPHDEPGAQHDEVPPPPTLPSRTAFVLAFIGVVVAGAFGATIGWGLARVNCADCTGQLAIGAVIGAVIAAIGAGIVAVLVLRAMSEWGRHGPDRGAG